MKKKAFLSLLVIASVGTGVGLLVTRAFFTDKETTTGNKFTVGTLDLEVGGKNGESAESFVIDGIGEAGDISGGKTWTVKNSGSLPGRLFFRLQNVVNEENGCNEPEKVTEPACDSDNNGELGGVIKTKVTINGIEVIAGKDLATANQSEYGAAWSALPVVLLEPGQTKTIGFSWSATENDYGNEIQSDSVKFDVDYNLVQLIAGPTPTN